MNQMQFHPLLPQPHCTGYAGCYVEIGIFTSEVNLVLDIYTLYYYLYPIGKYSYMTLRDLRGSSI